MKKLSLILMAISVTALTGCQSINRMNADYMHKTNVKAIQKPKNVQKCWENLAKFEQRNQKSPMLANSYAKVLEKQLQPTGSIWGGAPINANPCLLLPNYVPAAQQAITRARFIGSRSQQLRGYQTTEVIRSGI